MSFFSNNGVGHVCWPGGAVSYVSCTAVLAVLTRGQCFVNAKEPLAFRRRFLHA